MGQTTGNNMSALGGAFNQARNAPQTLQSPGGFRGQKGARPAPAGGGTYGIPPVGATTQPVKPQARTMTPPQQRNQSMANILRGQGGRRGGNY